MDIDLLAKKWEQEFTQAKNNPLYFALADLFRSYSKPLKLIENKVTFLEYLTFLEDHNVDAKTLVTFIKQHKKNLESGHFFPKINQLLKPLLVIENSQKQLQKKENIDSLVDKHVDLFLKRLNHERIDTTVSYEKALIDKIIKELGGLTSLGMRTPKDHMFIVKNVRERFQSYFETQVEKQILHTQIANIPMLNS